MGRNKTLGILSIIGGAIIPFLGITLAIIGLSISKKPKKEKDISIVLNIIGIAVSLTSWMMGFLLL